MQIMINSHLRADFDSVYANQDAIAIVLSALKQNWHNAQSYPYCALGIHLWVVADNWHWHKNIVC